MIIRKLFKFEGAHVVRDCSSDRCKFSIHGHSYKVEVFLSSDKLDNGGMIMDFGLLKTTVKDFIDSFDHCYAMWSKESAQFKNFIREENLRWIELPVTPSAEMFSLLFLFVIDKIIKNTEFANGEGNVQVSSVRVHETETGYAESFRNDLSLWKYNLSDIYFSPTIKAEWRNPSMWDDLMKGNKFINPTFVLKFQ